MNAFSIALLFAGAARCALSAETLLHADQWPSWRGPMANGTSATARPPVEWAEDRNVRWKVALPGKGSSTPIVWGQQVFILTAVPDGSAAPQADAGKDEGAAQGGGQPEGPGRPRGRRGGRDPGRGGGGMTESPGVAQRFVVRCLDRATGKTTWEHTAATALPHEGHHKDHGYASASPVTDGEVLVASFGSRGIHGYDMKGRPLWRRDLGRMQTRNGFGEGSSPALTGNTVIVLWDHEGEDFIVALDKRDGRELWRQKRDEPTGWCTPMVVEHGGRRQVVVNGTNKARGYDVETGELLWEAGGQTVNAIPSAVAGHGRVYLTSGYRGAALQAIQLGRKGDLTGTDAIAWSHGKGTPYVPSPLLAGDWLYLYSGNSGIVSVFDARDGKVSVDMMRVEGLGGVYASPVAADGRVYLVGRDGTTVVAKTGPTLDVLARNRLDDGFDASPALVGTEVFLRGRTSLYCIGTR